MVIVSTKMQETVDTIAQELSFRGFSKPFRGRDRGLGRNDDLSCKAVLISAVMKGKDIRGSVFS